MTLEQAFFVSQTVAAFAVVGSLLFVAWEMRNANRETRHRAAEEMHQSYRSLQIQVASDADLARVWVTGVHDLSSLESIDRVRFLLTAHAFFKNWENAFLVFAEGQLSREHLDPNEAMYSDLFGYGGLRAAWALRRKYFCKQFRDHVDAKIATLASEEAALPYESVSAAKDGVRS